MDKGDEVQIVNEDDPHFGIRGKIVEICPDTGWFGIIPINDRYWSKSRIAMHWLIGKDLELVKKKR